ncbi:hypothetical protein, partial [Enterococcus faecium]
VFFNSSQLSFAALTSVIDSTEFIGFQVLPDTGNQDSDPNTDSYLLLSWASVPGTFPNVSLPSTLFTATFTTTSSFHGSTTVNFGGTSAAGY